VIDLADIEAARRRIAPHIRKTPTLAYTQLKDGGAGGVSVTLKLELLQAAGSFKARGAMNRLMTLSEGQRDRGIVTASGGNHGLAIARSAHVLGARAQIFLPSNVVPDKVAKLKQWGASVEIVGAVWDDANAAALAFAERTGATYAHPFSDPVVVAGQGTLGLDVLDDMPDVDVILVAIGGGGLISGLSTAVKARRPATRIIGIEPAGWWRWTGWKRASRRCRAGRRTRRSSRSCATRWMRSFSLATRRWKARPASSGSSLASAPIFRARRPSPR